MAFFKQATPETPATGSEALLGSFVEGYSIEVMPRTAAKVDDFKALLPDGTRVYIAHIEGTPIEEMVETAARLSSDSYPVMPHFPARIIRDKAMLEDWILRYRDVGVTQALLLAGGVTTPHGELTTSMDLMESGLFDKHGFKHLHVAGHPEGNKDIDADGSYKQVDAALQWKQAFSERTDAAMAIATQFAFEAQPVIDWAERLKAAGISLPIHVGIAGPAKLQTLIKFAMACGVGPSIRVLQRRAMDIRKLVMPYEPTDVLADLAAHKASNPGSLIEQVHFFPLGGIKASTEWANEAVRTGALRRTG
jgi:methylenetetrahydrofolate reductase (NADPH)